MITNEDFNKIKERLELEGKKDTQFEELQASQIQPEDTMVVVHCGKNYRVPVQAFQAATGDLSGLLAEFDKLHMEHDSIVGLLNKLILGNLTPPSVTSFTLSNTGVTLAHGTSSTVFTTAAAITINNNASNDYAFTRINIFDDKGNTVASHNFSELSSNNNIYSIPEFSTTLEAGTSKFTAKIYYAYNGSEMVNPVTATSNTVSIKKYIRATGVSINANKVGGLRVTNTIDFQSVLTWEPEITNITVKEIPTFEWLFDSDTFNINSTPTINALSLTAKDANDNTSVSLKLHYNDNDIVSNALTYVVSPNVHTITINGNHFNIVSASGTFSGNSVTANHNSKVTIELSPESGYVVYSVTGADSSEQAGTSGYGRLITINSLTSDITINAYTTKSEITISHEGNATYTGAATGKYNVQYTDVITPNDNYGITSIDITGGTGKAASSIDNTPTSSWNLKFTPNSTNGVASIKINTAKLTYWGVVSGDTLAQFKAQQASLANSAVGNIGTGKTLTNPNNIKFYPTATRSTELLVSPYELMFCQGGLPSGMEDIYDATTGYHYYYITDNIANPSGNIMGVYA